MLRIVKPYKKCIIVWMDILGFADRVMESRSSRKETEAIAGILREADRMAKVVSKSYKKMHIKAEVFSDTILLTCPRPDVMAAEAVLRLASIYQIALMTNGFFLRGAALVDGHYSKRKANTAFGPGIIRSLDAEKLAIWPRIVTAPDLLSNLDPIAAEHMEPVLQQLGDRLLPSINDNLLRDFDQNRREHLASYFLARGADGLQCINYLRTGFGITTATRWVSEYTALHMPDLAKIDLLPMHRDAIVQAAKACAADNAKVLTKYHSLATYHNDVIDSLQNALSEKFDPDRADPSTDLGHLYLDGIAVFGMPQITVSAASQRDFLVQKIRELSQDIGELEKHKIQLPETFPTLYL